MENIVKFVNITQAQYDALQNKDAGSLYFISDTKRIYKGEQMEASELTPVYDGNGKQYSDWSITRDGADVTEDVEQPSWINTQ